MDWSTIGKAVAGAAPILAGALTGPLAPVAMAAGGILASFLGVEPTPQAVQAALTPEALVRIKELEIQKEDILLKYQAQQVNADLENTKSARDREVHMAQAGMGFASWGPPAIISAVITVGFFLVLFRYMEMKASDLPINDGFLILLGALCTAFMAVVNYYLGSSLGSTLKTMQRGK